MARLRRAVGEIEARSGPAETRAPGVGLSLTRALDRALGGGLAADALHEIVPATPGDGAAAMGFALALAARFMAEHSAAGLLMAEDFACHDAGSFYGPGLVAHGLELGRLVFVRAPDAPALFQAMEEALKSGAPAVVVGEVWRLQKYDLAVSRRLLLAARSGRAPALLVQASAYRAADRISSAAETRFEIAAAPSAQPLDPNLIDYQRFSPRPRPPPPPPPPKLRSVLGRASLTFNARPSSSLPFSSAIARSASEFALISTNPNPLG